MQARHIEDVAHKRRKLDIEDRMLLLREKEAGVISQTTYDHERNLITRGKAPCHRGRGSSMTPPSSPRRQRTPEWDYKRLDEEMENGSDIEIIDTK